MRILIIEDNVELAQTMKIGLEKENFYVDVDYTGCGGEEKAFVNEYDAILLDLNLPDKDGLEILSFLRASNINYPILIISARDDISNRALGLDSGADDYIVKPVQLLELRARLHAVIRRYHGRGHPIIQIEELCLNPSSRVATFKDVVIPLASKEFDILEYIASRHPAVVSAEEIAEHVYDEDFNPFSSVLRVHFTRLRKKLMEASGQEILVNIRGKGYHLCVK